MRTPIIAAVLLAAATVPTGHWYTEDTKSRTCTTLERAYDFIDRAVEVHAMSAREREWLSELDAGRTPDVLRDLLKIPLYDYQLRGAVFAASRGRAILGDEQEAFSGCEVRGPANGPADRWRYCCGLG